MNVIVRFKNKIQNSKSEEYDSVNLDTISENFKI